MTKIEELLQKCEEFGNLTIYDSFIKTLPKLQNGTVVCSISGGSDSDIMLDIVAKLDENKRVKYVFFDTGIEYQATKEHLNALEKKYDITIERIRAIKPVPVGCKEYGVPFWSKYVSEMIERLQNHGFLWEDEPFETLILKYPKCKIALKWWCNANESKPNRNSAFNINYVRGLKEFIIANPPQFKISNKCCEGAKKLNINKFLEENNAALSVVGIRKAEGGIRSTAYKSCFDLPKDGELWSKYRPIFWFSDKDKLEYEKIFDVSHSNCYSKYGLNRTGCAGCPFGRNFEEELQSIKQNEPKLYKAVVNIFGQSHEYTRKFLDFRKETFNTNGTIFKQENIFDEIERQGENK